MKNFKEQKLQVLAVLALAFSLGLVAPNAAVFASEEGAGTPVAQNAAEGGNQDGDGAGDKEEALKLDASIVELYDLIQTRESFANYRNSVALIQNTQTIEKSDLLEDAKTWAEAKECPGSSGLAGKLYTWLDNSTKTSLTGKKVYQVISALKADGEYTTNSGYKNIVDSLETSYNTLRETEVAQIAVAMPSVTGVADMDFAEMVTMVKSSPTYAKNFALYNSLAPLSKAISNNKVSLDGLKQLYSAEQLVTIYNAMAVAANAIDDTVMTGLDASWKLPTTSAGEDDKKTDVTTPNTGIVGMIETGALDLATLTLIASVVVASIAGLGLIAKLYLKHKF